MFQFQVLWSDTNGVLPKVNCRRKFQKILGVAGLAQVDIKVSLIHFNLFHFNFISLIFIQFNICYFDSI